MGFWSPKKVFKNQARKIEQKKTLQITNQTFPSKYDWEELIYNEKIIVENRATWCKAKNKIQKKFLWAQRIFMVKKSLNSKTNFRIFLILQGLIHQINLNSPESLKNLFLMR